MADQQSDQPDSNSPPAPLSYATHVGEYPQPQSHRGFVVFLIGLSALAGIWSIILGIMCLGDLLFFSLLLIGAGICLCWATIGKLSAKSLRLKAALVILIASLAIYIPVVVISHLIYVQQEAKYAKDLAAEQSDRWHTPTEAEQEVFTYKMIRDNAAVATALGLACCIYAGSRLLARRGVDFN